MVISENEEVKESYTHLMDFQLPLHPTFPAKEISVPLLAFGHGGDEKLKQ